MKHNLPSVKSPASFVKLYAAKDAVTELHCIRKDDSTGQIVFTVSLSGHLNTEPSQAAWAAFGARACNDHAEHLATIQEARNVLEACALILQPKGERATLTRAIARCDAALFNAQA